MTVLSAILRLGELSKRKVHKGDLLGTVDRIAPARLFHVKANSL